MLKKLPDKLPLAGKFYNDWGGESGKQAATQQQMADQAIYQQALDRIKELGDELATASEKYNEHY
jgi:hypothetical protein